MSSPQDNKESPSNDNTTTTSAATSTSTTPDESIQLDKAELYRKIDMIYQREKDMAVKVTIDKMNVELAAVKKIQKEEITLLRDEMEKLRKSIETDDDEVKAIEEATSKRNDEDDIIEGMRVQIMIREHQREKELLRETYEAKMVNAVEVALTKLRGEMQLLIDNEKEKATNLLRCLRDMQQQQQQPRQGHHAPQFYATTQGHSTQEHAMQGRDPTTVDNGWGLELTTKTISDRSLDVDEETQDYKSAPKRLKLVTAAAAARPFDPLRRSAASEERLLLTTKEGETRPGDSVCLWKNNVIPHEKSVPSSMGISAHWQMRPHQEGQLEAVVRPTTLTNEAEMMIENVRSVTADMKSPSKEQPHCTAVEALLFAAEKMDESTPSARKKPKKKPKRIIDESIAIEPTENDVLFGRGGYINIHPGNVRFRTKAFELRTWYEASTKEEKYNISKMLIESVKGEGHRFLEKTSDGLWHEVSGNGVRKKASQALRERVRGPTNSSDSVDSEEGKMSHTKHTTIADPHIPI